MNLREAIAARHSVRAYADKAIEGDILQALSREIDTCNREGNLHIQLVLNEPQAFDSRMAHYGHFSGVRNYIALVGPKSPELEEKCGYYGERIALYAQTLGLNTCWVALTFKKIPGAFRVEAGEKFVMVIAVGYGQTQGVPHKSKPLSAIAADTDGAPQWYADGVQAAMLAPTATNQQKFSFARTGNTVRAKVSGIGFYTKTDLGIVKYHFEIGAGEENFRWAE